MDLKRRYVAREERQEEGIVDYCADNGIGFISYSPLAQ
jgi:aryl-alcohol dehydrogenase-like predicted oxidoreductase